MKRRSQPGALLQFQFALALQTSDPPSGSVEHRFDIRPVYYFVNTSERDGSQHTDHSMNLRARYGISYFITNNLTFHSRAAMRLSINQNNSLMLEWQLSAYANNILKHHRVGFL